MNTTPIIPPQNKIVRIILCIFAVILTVGILLYLFDIITGDRFTVAGGRSNSGITFPEDLWIIASWIIGAVFCWWAAFRVQHSKYLNRKMSADDSMVYQVFRGVFGVSAGTLIFSSLSSIHSGLALGFDTFSVLVSQGPTALLVFAALWGACFVHIPESRRRMGFALAGGMTFAFTDLYVGYSNVLTTGANLGEQVAQNSDILIYTGGTLLIAVAGYCYARLHSNKSLPFSWFQKNNIENKSKIIN